MSGKKKTPPKAREDAKETERQEDDAQVIEIKTLDEVAEDQTAESGEEVEAEPVPESLEEQSAKLAQDKQELQERLLRAQADFDNYRKRVQKERADLLRYGSEGALREILPVIDNMELAVDSARTHDNSGDQLREGIEMVLSQFKSALERLGVRPIETLEHPFDPNKHEALMRVDAPEEQDGAVVGEIRKGYYLHDKVIRPAQVTVGAYEQEQTAPEASDETPDELAEEPQEANDAQ
jgi:molecular chaperone GrpE